METSEILKKVGIKPEQPVLSITAEEALENLLVAIKEYCPSLSIEKMSKKHLQALLLSYGNSVTMYHPENFHQERAALLENFEVLKHYGLSDEDYDSIDFC